MRTKMALGGMLLSVLLAGCGGGHPPERQGPREAAWHPPIEILLHYTDEKGDVTRASMEAGLHKDFAAADKNHDGVLEPDEVLAVNEQRWSEAESASSPLVDWNGDGVVDYDEFAATARALFDQLDPKNTGVITAKQLKALQLGPRAPREKEGGDDETHRRRGGRRGGSPDGDDNQLRGSLYPAAPWP